MLDNLYLQLATVSDFAHTLSMKMQSQPVRESNVFTGVTHLFSLPVCGIRYIYIFME